MKRPILLAALLAAALSAPAAFGQDAKPASDMREEMKAMQGQMDKIRQTTEPQERQKLMQEHMRAMQAGMETMRGMGKHGMSGGDAKMEGRADMMQMMMEQMMQHGQAMQSTPAR